uniref:Uncharacterized protein n=1 Tax=Rhizophora mucronata TaxID=61149 RepID=A0A2P2PPQ0_RHIMU
MVQLRLAMFSNLNDNNTMKYVIRFCFHNFHFNCLSYIWIHGTEHKD